MTVFGKNRGDSSEVKDPHATFQGTLFSGQLVKQQKQSPNPFYKPTVLGVLEVYKLLNDISLSSFFFASVAQTLSSRTLEATGAVMMLYRRTKQRAAETKGFREEEEYSIDKRKLE